MLIFCPLGIVSNGESIWRGPGMVPELQFRSHKGSVRGHSSDPKKCWCGVTPVPSPIPETHFCGAVSPLGPHWTAGAGTVPGCCLITPPILVSMLRLSGLICLCLLAMLRKLPPHASAWLTSMRCDTVIQLDDVDLRSCMTWRLAC